MFAVLACQRPEPRPEADADRCRKRWRYGVCLRHRGVTSAPVNNVSSHPNMQSSCRRTARNIPALKRRAVCPARVMMV